MYGKVSKTSTHRPGALGIVQEGGRRKSGEILCACDATSRRSLQTTRWRIHRPEISRQSAREVEREAEEGEGNGVVILLNYSDERETRKKE